MSTVSPNVVDLLQVNTAINSTAMHRYQFNKAPDRRQLPAVHVQLQ
jgi:hypothetical protein